MENKVYRYKVLNDCGITVYSCATMHLSNEYVVSEITNRYIGLEMKYRIYQDGELIKKINY